MEDHLKAYFHERVKFHQQTKVVFSHRADVISASAAILGMKMII